MTQTGPPLKSYGFIGLGVMGWGMATNLRAKIPHNAPLFVCEVNTERRDAWVSSTKGNITVASDPKEIAENCDIIITMLPRGSHVHQVFQSPENGLLTVQHEAKSSKLFIDCSTIDVQTSKAVAKAVERSGLGVFTDAPVSGGVTGSNAGSLTFMVGCSLDYFDEIKAVIKTMAKEDSIFHCGEVGAGLATKQINNYMSAVNMIAVCEGMNLGRIYGLDPRTLANVINVSTGMSYNSKDQNPVKGVSEKASAHNDFKGGFSTELCGGVLHMFSQLRTDTHAPSVLSDAVIDFYDRAVHSDKCKGRDFRSIYRLFSDGELDVGATRA